MADISRGRYWQFSRSYRLGASLRALRVVPPNTGCCFAGRCIIVNEIARSGNPEPRTTKDRSSTTLHSLSKSMIRADAFVELRRCA